MKTIIYCSTQMQQLVQRLQDSTSRLFVRELFNRPCAVGAVCPSSSQLAQRMAAAVPDTDNDLVVELGGGTGVITQALLARHVAPERLLVVERSSDFVRLLRRRFPGVTILQGDAAELPHLLPSGARIGAIVSSLPLCSLPADEADTVLAQWPHVLAPRGVAIQFTYHLRGKRWRIPSGFVERGSDIVWANLPPARVLTFEFRGGQPRIAAIWAGTLP